MTGWDDDEVLSLDPKSNLKNTDVKEILYLVGIVCFLICFRRLRYFLRLTIPTSVFMMVLGIVVGVILRTQDPWSYPIFFRYRHNAIMFILLALLFKASLFLDIIGFARCFWQVIVMAPCNFACTTLVGLSMHLITAYHWEIDESLVFGNLCVMILPRDTLQIVQLFGIKTRHVSTLIEGEIVVSSIICLYLIRCAGILYDGEQNVIHWYQFFFMFVVRVAVFGIVNGYFFGLLGEFLLKFLYKNPVESVMLTFCLFTVSVFVTMEMLASTAAFTVVVLGLHLNKARVFLHPDTASLLRSVWDTLYTLASATCYCLIAMYTFMETKEEYMHVRQFIYAFSTYLVYMTLRLVSHLVMMPILARLGYGITIKDVLVWVWCGICSPFGLCLLMHYEQKLDQSGCYTPALFYFTGLSHLINASLVRVLLRVVGFLEVTPVRLKNMNASMRYLAMCRTRYTEIIRLDPFSACINWTVFYEALIFKHPYTHVPFDDQSEAWDEIDDATSIYRGYRFTRCSDCNLDVYKDPTPAELVEMTTELRQRILKLTKISLQRQHQQGLLSNESLFSLNHAVEVAMDTKEAIIPLEEVLRLFHRDTMWSAYFRRFLSPENKQSESPVDDNYSNVMDNTDDQVRSTVHNVLYQCLRSRTFLTIVFVVVVTDLSTTILEIVLIHVWPETSNVYSEIVWLLINTGFVSFYTTEAILKIVAFSYVSVFQGIRIYLMSIWRCLEAFVIAFGVVDMTFCLYNLIYNEPLISVKHSRTALLVGTLFVASRLLYYFRFLKDTHTQVARYIDRQANYHVALAYELSKAYATSIEEALQLLPVMVDNEHILLEIRRHMEHDRLAITRVLGLVQKEKPWIGITVKTAQAIGTVLNGMKTCARELKTAGQMDEFEYEKVMECLEERDKYIAMSLKFVGICSTIDIFRQVPWMGDDEILFDFLYDHSICKKLKTGDVLCQKGHVCEGIYMLVSGLLAIHYEPDNDVLEQYREYGCLPIVDTLTKEGTSKAFTDYIVSGNCVGELCTLTGRPYDCDITAETFCDVILIPRYVIHEAMDLDLDELYGLDSRLWKTVSARVVIPMLMARSTTTMQSFTSVTIDTVRFSLERAVVPNLKMYEFFEDPDNLTDFIVLVEGIVMDLNTRERFVAPCYIPYSAKCLALIKNVSLDVPQVMETRLVLIPRKDVTMLASCSTKSTYRLAEAMNTCVLHKEYRDGLLPVDKREIAAIKKELTRRRMSQSTYSSFSMQMSETSQEDSKSSQLEGAASSDGDSTAK